jgi:hypothetical protein
MNTNKRIFRACQSIKLTSTITRITLSSFNDDYNIVIVIALKVLRARRDSYPKRTLNDSVNTIKFVIESSFFIKTTTTKMLGKKILKMCRVTFGMKITQLFFTVLKLFKTFSYFFIHASLSAITVCDMKNFS